MDLESYNTNKFSVLDVGNDPGYYERAYSDLNKLKPVTIFGIFRYSDWIDKILILVGVIAAAVMGASQPLMSVLVGGMLSGFDMQTDYDAMMDVINLMILYMLILAIVTFFVSTIQNFCLRTESERQGIRIRKLYFKALLRQELGWYDLNKVGELTSRLPNDMFYITDATGEKLGQLIQGITTFIGGFAIGFSYSWSMTLVICCVSPLIMGSGLFLGIFSQRLTKQSQNENAKAGGIAEEVLSSIRTVASFSGEKKEINRYIAAISKVQSLETKKGYVLGIGFGFIFFFLFATYGVAFWFGSVLVNNGHLEASRVMTVFMAVMMGSSSVMNIIAPFSSFNEGRGAATRIFNVIERKSLINAQSEKGIKEGDIRGNIQFKDVFYCYPSRPTISVLNGFNLTIKRGEKVALVGESGCGKSTIVSILQRLYDVTGGDVIVDGKEIEEYNIHFIRKKIGIVSQEPNLFAMSIKENIAIGAVEGEPSQELIEECAKKANAHNFIMDLPNKYDTVIGERGTQLSGGQKQRIAIARALIRDPRILLLDEATSALDTESEKLVQQALDLASEGRTTIIVAHRLSTIKNADKICVVQFGRIVEIGKHQELMKKHGKYYRLVKRQKLQVEEEEEEEEESPTVIKGSALKGKLGRQDSSLSEVSNTVARMDEVLEEDLKSKSKLKALLKSYLLYAPDWPSFLISMIAQMGIGCIFPVFTLIMTDVITALLSSRGDELYRRITPYIIGFFGVAFLSGILSFLGMSGIVNSGVRLTFRLRKMIFSKYLEQNVAYYDKKENMTGVLMTRLASDPGFVQMAGGMRIGSVIQMFAALVCGVVIAFTGSYKVALVAISVIPYAMVGMILRGRLGAGAANPEKKSYEQSGVILVESIENIRTVYGLVREDYFIKKYIKTLRIPTMNIYRLGPFMTLGMAYSACAGSFVQSILWWFGTTIAKMGDTDFNGIMRSIMGIMFGAMGIGSIATYISDFTKGANAALYIFRLFERKPPISITSEEGVNLWCTHGEIEFEKVHFRYPTRPDVPVLKGISFKLQPGKTVALVGQSGCGKSTVIQLIERFYDICSGSIKIDGVEIAEANVEFLRNQIGYVGQEPVLFGTSIADNIGYGRKGKVSMEEIIAVAKQANAHEFICGLPEGYNTLCGERGTQLSGGQKQRIAIARALIRNPKILLLDEATSALDSQSEGIVQDALDRASEGRSTIVVAHRLSTIQNADEILVFVKGRIVERGTHSELMKLKGVYHNLASEQMASPVG